MCDMFSRMEDERLDYIRKGKMVEADVFGDQEDDADDSTLSVYPSFPEQIV